MTPVRRDPQLRRTARRLGLQTGVLIVLCLVAVAVVQLALVERSSVSAARSRLADVTSSIDKPQEAPRDVLVTLDGPQGRLSSTGLPKGLPLTGDLSRVQRTGVTEERSLSLTGHEYLVRTERSGNRTIQAALDRQPIEDESRRLIFGLVWAGLFGVLLAAVLAYWLAHRAVKPMAETIAMQRRFVADASHELRTPLTLLSTRVQLLARKLGKDDNEFREDVDGVLSDTRNLTEILDELLLAADTRDSQERKPQLLDTLVRDAVSSARAEADARGIDLVLDVERNVSVDVAAAAVRRAVLALVDNALDHAHSHVMVRVFRSGRRAVVSVEDDGPGIDPAVIPHVFDRFATSRSPVQDPRQKRHYGLGLALVSEVASAHDGVVTARNRSSEPGAVISLELPALR